MTGMTDKIKLRTLVDALGILNDEYLEIKEKFDKMERAIRFIKKRIEELKKKVEVTE